MRILVAIPKPFYNRDLTKALSTGFKIIETVLNDPKTVEETRRRNPEVMLLEINLQEGLGTEEIACSLLDRENLFSPSPGECVLCELRKVPDQVEEVLNERQREVLHLVAQGLDYVKVGERLFISERTVKYHMAKIKQTLHLSSQGQVVAWAWEHGIGYREPN